MGSPKVTPLVENRHDGGFIVSEANGHRSRDRITLTGAAIVIAGTVLGEITIGTSAVAAALGTNTGNGTFGAITVGSGVQLGAYTVRFASATKFVVEDPQGVEVGHGTTGVAYSAGGIGFTITAGGTAFVEGDSFTVTVAAGSGKSTPLDLTATNGAAVATQVLFGTTDVTAADKTATAMTRSCEVNGSELIWPAGITDNQIATAVAQLKKAGIIVR